MSLVRSVEENYGKPLSPKHLEELIQRVCGWALLNGAQMTVTTNGFPERIAPMPLTLFPSILPSGVLRKVKSLQPAFQTLLYKVANDNEFMKDCFSQLLNVDQFIKQLWDIYETVRTEGPAQEISLTLSRNDFMMEYSEEDAAEHNCKQVEYNTIAAGGSGRTGSMVDVHRYSLSLADIPFEEGQLPANNPTVGQAKGLFKAWKLYQNKSAVILFAGVLKACTPDQRLLEKDIYRINRSTKVIYRTFPQLMNQMSLGGRRELLIDGTEVAVVYYRYGFSPKHYPTDAEFKLRLDIERSRAIKCPTVAVHLAGCKKVQQMLAEPGVLERFIQDTDVIKDIRSTFVGLYSLDKEVSLTMTRNDFMMECSEGDAAKQTCKQVEFNTIAVGGSGRTGSMVDVHRYSLSLEDIPFTGEQLPDNKPTIGQAKGLVTAWQLYQNKSAVILFVGVPESCTPDQRWIERDIYRINRSVKVIYRTFPQLIDQISLGEGRELLIDGTEVAVVYYRYGYSPKHYPTDAEFDLRIDIERSRAIKCPTVAVHLAGCKKIQQVLAEPGVLERFIQDTDVIKDIRSTFVGLYSLDKKDSNKIITQALQTPERFVLKPQREGGGNNLFGDDLKNCLEKIEESPERSSWILMDLIQAARHKNRLIRVGLEPKCREVVSELGIFGVHISTPTSELENFECGYLLRTKPAGADEGGLCEGLSCIDTPFLV